MFVFRFLFMFVFRFLFLFVFPFVCLFGPLLLSQCYQWCLLQFVRLSPYVHFPKVNQLKKTDGFFFAFLSLFLLVRRKTIEQTIALTFLVNNGLIWFQTTAAQLARKWIRVRKINRKMFLFCWSAGKVIYYLHLLFCFIRKNHRKEKFSDYVLFSFWFRRLTYPNQHLPTLT